MPGQGISSQTHLARCPNSYTTVLERMKSPNRATQSALLNAGILYSQGVLVKPVAVERPILRTVCKGGDADLLPQLLQHLSRDYHALDLIGAFDDLSYLGLAKHRLHRIVLAGAVTAEDLNRIRGYLHGRVGRQ